MSKHSRISLSSEAVAGSGPANPRISKILLCLLLPALWAGPSVAQTPTVPVGDELQLDSADSGEPAVATNADGDFAIVWEKGSIQLQRFASDGSSIGAQLEVTPNARRHTQSCRRPGRRNARGHAGRRSLGRWNRRVRDQLGRFSHRRLLPSEYLHDLGAEHPHGRRGRERKLRRRLE